MLDASPEAGEGNERGGKETVDEDDGKGNAGMEKGRNNREAYDRGKDGAKGGGGENAFEFTDTCLPPETTIEASAIEGKEAAG